MYKCNILADSKDNRGNRITSFLLTYPRIIHAELMTHRMFSRNSASSRAIPFKKMVKQVEKDPFIPIAWQFDHKGMQGNEYVTEESDYGGIEARNTSWLEARDKAVEQAKDLYSMDTTKQLCNRLLEPFMWHTTLVTATEWENFFELRCPMYVSNKHEIFKSKKDFIKANPYMYPKSELSWRSINKGQADIHIQAIAELMWDAYNENVPKQLEEGEWHVPFSDNITDMDLALITDSFKNVFQVQEGYARKYKNTSNELDNIKIKIATARCARLSYMTFDNKIDYEKDIQLHDQLLKDKHFSPFEHCARVMSDEEYYNFVKGVEKVKKHSVIPDVYYFDESECGWCTNLKGFISYRYLIENKL